jgi:hypothetical protein
VFVVAACVAEASNEEVAKQWNSLHKHVILFQWKNE